MTTDGDVTVYTNRSTHPVEFLTRNDTNDAALVVGIIGADEYGLGALPRLSGVAIDIGAHIGTVALALAVDHPDLRVIAVEVVPENVEVLRANVIHNKLEGRVQVIEAAAAAPGDETVEVLWGYRTAGTSQTLDQAYVDDSRFIANIFDKYDSDGDTHTVKAVSLDQIMDGIDRVALLKIDCEGCEWAFLRSPRVADCDRIIGEFHNEDGLAGITRLLGATHEVKQTGGASDIGTFLAVAR